MADNDEILDMLKQILDKLKKLETLKADNITVKSGSIKIEASSKNPIEVSHASDVTINTGESTSQISVELPKGNINSFSITTDKVSTISIEAGGDITGEINANE